MISSLFLIYKFIQVFTTLRGIFMTFSDIGPASVMVGNIVQGNRLATACGRDLGPLDEDPDGSKKVGHAVAEFALDCVLL